jgi:hypothetical protein
MHAFKQWLKHGNSPLARFGYQAARAVLSAQLPPIPGVHRLLYRLYRLCNSLLDNLMRCLWWTPLLQSRLLARAPRLYLYGGLPAIIRAIRWTPPNARATCRTARSRSAISCSMTMSGWAPG